MTTEPGPGLGLAMLGAVQGRLRAGTALRVLTREDPELLLLGLNVQLRDALAWEKSAGKDRWEALLRLAADAPAGDIVSMLKRDHRRLDELLGRALRRLNAGDHAGAAPLLAELADGLRRHAALENDVLGPPLGGEAPLETMVREHDELLAELEQLEACEDDERETFAALLSGTLAKHEQREEQALFPRWAAQLARLGDEERRALEIRVREGL